MFSVWKNRTVPYLVVSYYTRIVKLVVYQTSNSFFTMMILFRTYTMNKEFTTDVIAHLSLKKDYGLCLQTIIDFVFGLDIEP